MRVLQVLMVWLVLFPGGFARASTSPETEGVSKFMPLERKRGAMPLAPRGEPRFYPLVQRSAVQPVPLVQKAEMPRVTAEDMPNPKPRGGMDEEQAKLLLFIFGADD
jgi:hypothetical protein